MVNIYNCAKCEKIFTNRANLESHLETQRLKRVKYGCQICGKRFYSEKYLN